MADDTKKKQAETEFYYENPKNPGGRGSGYYPIDEPGTLVGAIEQMRVGDYNKGDLARQRARAQAKRGR
jgi:hypothetical protein